MTRDLSIGRPRSLHRRSIAFGERRAAIVTTRATFDSSSLNVSSLVRAHRAFPLPIADRLATFRHARSSFSLAGEARRSTVARSARSNAQPASRHRVD
jgi:hypothetical protein